MCYLGEMPRRSNLIDIIPTLSPAWYVSFDIYPISSGDWRSVVHFVSRNWKHGYGGQVPEVVMHYSRLYIYNAVNGYRSHQYVSNPLTFNKYSRVEISQKLSNISGVLYTIRIDGRQVYQIINSDARYFENVYVYKGNPWRNPANVLIKNFIYKNLPDGGRQ